MRTSIYILILALFFSSCTSVNERVIEPDLFKYELPWIDSFSVENTIINRVIPPVSYDRIKADQGSFAHWLRRLPLKVGNPDIKLYDGRKKLNQSAHSFVLDLDVGLRDLQQCADATMRLRAEYLYNNDSMNAIHFNYTNGAFVPFSKWKEGFYPVPKSGKVLWQHSSNSNASYKSFRRYMNEVFNYAGTLSLSRELKSIQLEDVQPGDLFVYGGTPGHAVMVMDVAVHEKSGEKVFLLGQGCTPAQEMHIIKNPKNYNLSPWYSVSQIGVTFRTPGWIFHRNALMRWVD